MSIKKAIVSELRMLDYKIRHKVFQWRKDGDGDLALVVGGKLAFVKYKEHTIVKFPWEENFPVQEAGKYQGHER